MNKTIYNALILVFLVGSIHAQTSQSKKQKLKGEECLCEAYQRLAEKEYKKMLMNHTEGAINVEGRKSEGITKEPVMLKNKNLKRFRFGRAKNLKVAKLKQKKARRFFKRDISACSKW